MIDWFRRLRVAIAPAVAYEDLLRVINWMGSHDTGLSSKAMAIQLSGAVVLREKHLRGDYFSYPHDNGDLGRCIRFLRYMGWEHRAKEMRGVSNEWTALAKHWDELTRLYEIAEQVPEHVRYTRPAYPRRRRMTDAQWEAALAEYKGALAQYEKLPHCVLYNRMKAILDPAEAKTRAAYERRQQRKAAKRKAA